MKRIALIPLGLAALIATGIAWFLASYERVPAREPVAMKGEARFRHFLAAQRFAGRMGLRTREVRSLPGLDAVPQGAVLVMPAGRQLLDASRLDQLVAWVERGGHLVVEAEPLRVKDALLDRVGVQRTAAPPAKDMPVEIDGTPRSLSVALFGPALRVPAGARLRARAGPAGAPKLVSFARGKGLVTVSSSLAFARNRLIGENDHAAFLWALLRLGPAEDMQVFFRPERLSLSQFLLEHAAAALAAGAALLALWLWRIVPRFGPLVPDQPPARRRLLDHLRASGRYYWSHGLRSRLVAAARDAMLRRIARAQPDFAAAPLDQQAARLAALAGIPPQDARRLLASSGELHGADFIRLMHQAQRVHGALERGRTGRGIARKRKPI